VPYGGGEVRRGFRRGYLGRDPFGDRRPREGP
jgi:hypothetical protein